MGGDREWCVGVHTCVWMCGSQHHSNTYCYSNIKILHWHNVKIVLKYSREADDELCITSKVSARQFYAINILHNIFFFSCFLALLGATLQTPPEQYFHHFVSFCKDKIKLVECVGCICMKNSGFTPELYYDIYVITLKESIHKYHKSAGCIHTSSLVPSSFPGFSYKLVVRTRSATYPTVVYPFTFRITLTIVNVKSSVHTIVTSRCAALLLFSKFNKKLHQRSMS